uniref:Fatty acyl-CoA reductase n=2 Tax=Cacopsylla melanoneura TaxID=428564 RepID=A0A8D8WY92_9HEMI
MGNNSVLGSLKRKKKKSGHGETEDSFQEIGMTTETIMDYFDKRDHLVEPEIESDEDSEIQKFYKSKNVLMTGASGFIGTILLEKLLRCTDVRKVYVLFRGKRNQGLDERLREYFAEDVFDRLRKEKGEFHHRVVILNGDLREHNLGLDEETREFLMEEINVVFHVAATVKFDEHLRLAHAINCKGTETLLKMGEDMKNLESFVYVSTAYSNCHRESIDEKFYEPIYKPNELKEILDSCTDLELTLLNETIIQPMPNTYTLTKNTNEYMCKQRIDKLPLVIVRPSVVMPTDDEPLPLWSKGMTGLTAMYVAVGLGIMRSVYQNTENIIDIVPGDYVVNVIIGAGWEIGTRKQKTESVSQTSQEYQQVDKNNNPIEKKFIAFDVNENNRDEMSRNGYAEVGPISERFVDEHNNVYETTVQSSQSDATNTDLIYNMVSYAQNPITLGESNMLVINSNNESEEGCEQSLWVIHHNPTNKRWVYFLYFYIFNILPTVLFFQYLEQYCGKKSQLMKIYRKIFFLNSTIETFTMKGWAFSDGNTQQLHQSMCEKDKRMFGFSIKNVNWEGYHKHLHRGLSKYAIITTMSKEMYNTRVKYMRLVDNIVINGFKLFFVYLLCHVFLRVSHSFGMLL